MTNGDVNRGLELSIFRNEVEFIGEKNIEDESDRQCLRWRKVNRY